MKTAPLLIALGLASIAGTVHAQAVAGPDDVRARLAAAGYDQVRDIEFDDGLWEAEVRHADGRWHDVAVATDSGEVLDDRGDRALLDAATLVARLEAAGYTQVRDLDLDDAVWEADALGRDGQRVELKVNAHSGVVLSEEMDD